MAQGFDNSKPNVIILSDLTDTLFMTKTFGPFKVAHELRESGYEVAVVHHLHIFSYDEILNILRHLVSDKTLFVGFNNMFYKSLEHVKEANNGGIKYSKLQLGSMLPHSKNLNKNIKQFIKELNPNCKTVLGGPTASDIELNKDFDYLVLGYADKSVVNLADFLFGSADLQKFYRSIYGPVVINDVRAEGFDFSNSKMQYKSYDCILPGEVLPIEVARGCIFNCAFCSYPLNGKKKLDFIKNTDLLYKEFIENYENFGVTRYLMNDDTFNDSPEKAAMMYEISKRLPFKLEYWASIRLDLLAAHPKTVDQLFHSGLRSCHFGIETFNKQSGSIVGKGLDKQRQLETIRAIKSRWGNSVMLHGSFIAGLPYESIESLQRTFDSVMNGECLLDSWIFHAFSLTPKMTSDQGWSSKISLDPGSYGYFNLSKIENSNNLYWQNDHMDFYRAIEIVDEFNRIADTSTRKRITGATSFNIASIGFDLEYSANKIHSEFDWHSVKLRKDQRIKEYKTLFGKEFSILL